MPKSQFSVRIKRIVRQRARGCCEYCLSQERFATHDFSIEHIIPASKQGSDSLDNLALSCQGCNNFKYNKIEATDPVSGIKCPLFHPRNQSWEEHFSWDESYVQMVGKTPVGRATIEALRLNREKLVNLRRALFLLKEHPPGDVWH
jgi:hypothetical protein